MKSGWIAAGIMLVSASAALAQGQQTQTAIFAGGCFWCVEADFDKVKGVLETTSGYTGGTVANPEYKQVSAGGTGHQEAVQVTYDPNVVSYAQLLDLYWRNVDPFDAQGQFCDKGDSYRAVIFATPEQRSQAEESLRTIDARFDQPIAVEIKDARSFYPAEDYHQDYYKKNPAPYKFYRWRCGRDARLEEVWGN